MVATPAEIARLIGAQPIPNTSLSSFGPLPTGRPQPKAAPQGGDLYKAMVSAGKQRGTVAPPQQDRGFLGDVLGSTIGKAVMKPFELLGAGAAYVGSGVKELGDALQGSNLGHWLQTGDNVPDWLITQKSEAEYQKSIQGSGAASWQQFLDQGSQRKGMGDYIQELRPDANYAYKLGFGIVGDIATDPLTYLTAGSTAVAGKAARQGLAAKAALADAGEMAAKGVAREQMIAHASKGAAWLTPAERSFLGVEKAGLRAGFNGGVRIPGTAKIAEYTGKATGNVRRVAMRPWQTLSRDAEYLKTANKVLETGATIGAMTPVHAASLVGWDREYRTVSKAIGNAASQEAEQVLKGLDKAAREALTHEIESGVPNAMSDVFAKLHKTAIDAGVDMNRIENYVPHMWTKEGRAFIDGSTVEDGAGHRVKIDLTNGSGVSMERQIKAGSTIHIPGKAEPIKITDGSIAGINKAITDAFPDSGVKEFLKSDAQAITAGYISMLSSDIGEVKAFRKLLASRNGTVGAFDDVSDEVLQMAMTRTANGEQKKAIEKLLKVREAAYKAEQKTATKAAKNLQAELVRHASQGVADLGEVGTAIAKQLDDLAAQGKSLDQAAASIVNKVSTYRMAKTKDVQRLAKKAAALDEKLSAAKLAAAAGDTAAEKRLAALTEQQVALQVEFSAAEAAAKNATEVGNRLAEFGSRHAELSANADNPDVIAQHAQDMLGQSMNDVALGKKVEAATAKADQVVAAPPLTEQNVARMGRDLAAGHKPQAVKALEQVDSAKQAVDIATRVTKDTHEAHLKEVAKITERLRIADSLNVAKADTKKTAEQLKSLVEQAATDADVGPVLALHQAYAEQLAKVVKAGDDVGDAKYFLNLAKKGAHAGNPDSARLVSVYDKMLLDGWSEVGQGLLKEGDRIAVQEPIALALKNWRELSRTGDVWKSVEKLTNFFKAYATATPGFHVRNAMGAAFMNATEGVTFKTTSEAISAWREYMKNPMDYLKGIEKSDPQLFEAFKGALGSGAGGAFVKEEVEATMASTIGDKALHNFWTKRSRQAGEWVEGPARLALGIHTTRAGGDAAEALARITRVHFDYTQLSKLDRVMKLPIPFWTFMSRNLPLQIQQMWMRPRLYSAWNHVVENVSAGSSFDAMPSWMEDKSAIPLGNGAEGGGNQWALMPDLQHLNAGAELAKLDPRGGPLQMLSAMNPMIVAPLEAASNKRFAFDSPIGDMGDRLTHAVTQMLPPIAMAQRLTGQDLSGAGRYAGQADEKWLNFLGIPLQKITPKEQANARRFG